MRASTRKLMARVQSFRLHLVLCIFAVQFVQLLGANDLFAREAPPLADDVQVEARLEHIAEELRCLVCQNESLASSRADLAEDLRAQVREQIAQGRTDQEIRDYLVERYGDFVLYRPKLKPMTWLLWFGPFVGLVIGLWVLLTALKRRSTAVTNAVHESTSLDEPSSNGGLGSKSVQAQGPMDEPSTQSGIERSESPVDQNQKHTKGMM